MLIAARSADILHDISGWYVARDNFANVASIAGVSRKSKQRSLPLRCVTMDCTISYHERPCWTKIYRKQRLSNACSVYRRRTTTFPTKPSTIPVSINRILIYPIYLRLPLSLSISLSLCLSVSLSLLLSIYLSIYLSFSGLRYLSLSHATGSVLPSISSYCSGKWGRGGGRGRTRGREIEKKKKWNSSLMRLGLRGSAARIYRELTMFYLPLPPPPTTHLPATLGKSIYGETL